jgi:two-component system phosphate regulon sensor histidine kinase PhoR
VEVDRLAQMVEELGELSLLETGQVSLERKPVNIAILVEEAVGRLEAQAERAGLSVTVDVPDNLPEPMGDARRLEQALVNLVHNSIKFTPAGGAITVAARRDGAGVSVSVTDTGIGIHEENLERVFERFYKADRSRTSSGTGLGLAIVRHVVQLHGGRVWAESRAGAGATFTFTVPLDGGAG